MNASSLQSSKPFFDLSRKAFAQIVLILHPRSQPLQGHKNH